MNDATTSTSRGALSMGKPDIEGALQRQRAHHGQDSDNADNDEGCDQQEKRAAPEAATVPSSVSIQPCNSKRY